MLMFGPYVNAVFCHFFIACNFNALCRHFFRFGDILGLVYVGKLRQIT